MLSFLKSGISNKLDRSEHHLINISSLEDYEMPAPEKEFHLLSDKESDDSDVESDMSFDKSKDDASSSSENSSVDSSLEDCWNLTGCLIIFSEEIFP